MMNEQNDREELLSIYSDIHKDAYGCRPYDWQGICKLTDEEIQKEIDELSEIASIEVAREEQIEAKKASAEAAHLGRQDARLARAFLGVVAALPADAREEFVDIFRKNFK